MTNEDRTTNAPRALRRDAGVPRGPARRKHCGVCGAEGVARRTCTGDAESHGALAKAYQPSDLPRPASGSSSPTGNETSTLAELERDQEETPSAQAARLVEEGVISPDVERVEGILTEMSWGDLCQSDADPEPEPRPDEGIVTLRAALVHEVTLTVVTRYPALVMGRLEHMVEEGLEEALWVSTEAHALTRIES